MRIYNGTKSQLDLPLNGIHRITIAPRSVSGDFLPSNSFLSLLVTSFDYSDIAIIVSGPYEISMCAGVSGTVGFVVQSLEEAIERFAEKTPKVVEEEKKMEEVVTTTPKPEPVITTVEPVIEKQPEVVVEEKEEKATKEDLTAEEPVKTEEVKEEVAVEKKAKKGNK